MQPASKQFMTGRLHHLLGPQPPPLTLSKHIKAVPAAWLHSILLHESYASRRLGPFCLAPQEQSTYTHRARILHTMKAWGLHYIWTTWFVYYFTCVWQAAAACQELRLEYFYFWGLCTTKLTSTSNQLLDAISETPDCSIYLMWLRLSQCYICNPIQLHVYCRLYW